MFIILTMSVLIQPWLYAVREQKEILGFESFHTHHINPGLREKSFAQTPQAVKPKTRTTLQACLKNFAD